MLVGHYAGAYVARGLDRRLPLWAAFLGAQLVDVGWALAILTGVERARLVPGLPSNPLDLYYMPFTHSLMATAVWAALAFVGVRASGLFGGSTRVAACVALAVGSHWFLDLPVHRGDLPLWSDDSPKVGLGLWNHPLLALTFELGVLVLATAWYLRRTGEAPRLVWAFTGGMGLLQVMVTVAPIPPHLPLLAGSLLALYLLLARAAGRVSAAAQRAAVPR